MNAIMPMMPAKNTLFLENNPKDVSSGFQLFFQSVLATETGSDTTVEDDLKQEVEDLLESISKLLDGLSEGVEMSSEEEKELESITQLLANLSSQYPLLADVKNILEERFRTLSNEEKAELLTLIQKQVSEKEQLSVVSHSIQNFLFDVTQLTTNLAYMEKSQQANPQLNLLSYVETIMRQVDQFSSQPTDSTERIKAAAQILQQLKEITSFLKQEGIQLKDSNQMFKQILSQLNGGSEKQEMIQMLVQNYLKRTSGSSKGGYVQNATVTSQDISKWISQAMERQGITVKTTNQAAYVPDGIHMPMSKMEQYMIRLPENQQQQNKFVQEFQKIVQKSQFMNQPGGLQQLSIRLQPENLGNMMMRFVEVDGEMIVKITVTSQVAKDLLEGNLHQLKHMFSPHQVVVERQDQSQQTNFLNQKQQDQFNQNQQQSKQDQEQQNQEKPKEEHEESLFKEFLLNMKV